MASTVRIGSILAAAGLASAAFGQAALYSNASANPSVPALATGSVSLSGVPAPSGGVWSEAASSMSAANILGGLSTHRFGGAEFYRFADDFTIPQGGAWRITAVSTYVYLPGDEGSPIAAMNIRIWQGRPGDPDSFVLFGDDSTDRLSSLTATNIFRIFNSVVQPQPQIPDATRRIWQADAAIDNGMGGLVLQPGTFWIDWQVVPTSPDAQIFSPTATIPGVRGQPDWNALQFKPGPGAGAWHAVIDTGKPVAAAHFAQDMPFIIRGVPVCLADFNGDGQLDFFDYLDFVNAFGNGAQEADFNRDGQVDFFDYLDFVNAFAEGCD